MNPNAEQSTENAQADDTMHRCVWVRKRVQNASATGVRALSYLCMRKHRGASEYTYSHTLREPQWISLNDRSEDIEKKGVKTLPLATCGYLRCLIYW